MSVSAEDPAAWPPALLDPARRADLVLVFKGARELVLQREGCELARFAIALGPAPLGHKQREGDGRTPEGRYRISARNPRSRFHLSLRISYPDPDDLARAQAQAVPAGGDIMIHGNPERRGGDWTEGCVAVSDAEMEAIWQRVETGTPVHLLP